MATPLFPLRLHVVNGPDRVLVIATVPVGVISVPGLVSETVTEQTVGFPAMSVFGEQFTESEVVRCATVRVVDPVTPLTHAELDRA